MSEKNLLDTLAQVLEERKAADPSASYVAKLYNKGLDSILKKLVKKRLKLSLRPKMQIGLK